MELASSINVGIASGRDVDSDKHDGIYSALDQAEVKSPITALSGSSKSISRVAQ